MTNKEKFQTAKLRALQIVKARPWVSAGTALVLIFGVVYLAKGSPAPAAEVVRTPIAVQTIALAGLDEAQTQISTSGIIESLDQVDMKSESFGTVTRVNAKVGQVVRSGAILVQLDTKSIDAQISQASASLSRAQASLNARLAGATEEQIAQSQAGLDAANAQLALTVSSMDAAVEQAKIAEASALLSLQNAQAGIGIGDSTTLISAENTARSSFASAMNSLAVITDYQYRYFYCTSDQICRDIENAKEDAVRTLVGATDAGQWTMTSISQQRGGIFADLENLSSENASYSDDLVAILEKEADALRDLQTALASVRTGLETALAANATAAEKSAVEAEQSGVDLLIATVTGTAQGVVALPVTAKTSVDAAQSSYDRAVAARIAAEEQREANIALAQSSVASAQAGYNATVADPRSVDIAGLEAGVREARASLSILSAQREKLILRAPFSGTVSAIRVKRGELVTSGMSVVSIVNDDALQVQAYVSERERPYIAVGAKVAIGESGEGTVVAIAPSVDPLTGKVEVVIGVTNDRGLTIGDSADVVIEINRDAATEALRFLPLSAVKLYPDRSVVLQVKDGVLVEIPVTVGEVVGSSVSVEGLPTEGEIVENARGVRAGDLVVVTE